MNQSELYAFAMRGLLTDVALDKAGRKPKGTFSDVWESESLKRLGLPLMDEAIVVKSRKMAVVYTAICAFENSVREFIEKKLLEEIGENWWNVCVKKEIRDIAEGRQKSEKDVRWLTPRGSSLVYYTEFGDLIAIMAKPDNWKFFEVHIGNIEWAKQIISTLEKSRNIIMHSGELAATDVERVGMYIRDWIRQVG
jgi:hypothetical protein